MRPAVEFESSPDELHLLYPPESRIAERMARMRRDVFLRADFAALGGV
jgi:hypothetical protein